MQGFILKIVSIIASIMSFFGLIRTPASMVELESAEHYPYVLVHGLLGWGDTEAFDDVFEYWGGDRDIPSYLNTLGCETYVASVAPISSAWDRACELYAQLTGSRVDYGKAHSEEHGHGRYGMTYEEPLFEGWGADNKINLFGHSFGGATVRLFTYILANGSAEEIAATDADDISPFFTGGKADYIHSVTALAAPHNGSTFTYALDVSEDSFAMSALVSLFSAYGNTSLRVIREPMLEHWGITASLDDPIWSSFDNDKIQYFIKGKDSAAYDLSIHGARELNEKIGLVEGIYYYSYYALSTKESPITGNHVSYTPHLLTGVGNIMGRIHGEFDGEIIDKSWLPNDSIVNLVSAKYPFTDEFLDFDVENQVTGIWQLMPQKTHWNHCTFMIANDPVLGKSELEDFYISHINLISSSY